MGELHGCRLVIRFENNCVAGCLFGGLTPFVTALIACLSGSALSVQAGCQINAALVAYAYRGHKDDDALSRMSAAERTALVAYICRRPPGWRSPFAYVCGRIGADNSGGTRLGKVSRRHAGKTRRTPWISLP